MISFGRYRNDIDSVSWNIWNIFKVDDNRARQLCYLKRAEGKKWLCVCTGSRAFVLLLSPGLFMDWTNAIWE